MAKRRQPEKKKKIKELKLAKFPNCIGTYPDEGCLKATKEKPTTDCISLQGVKCVHYSLYESEKPVEVKKKSYTKKKKKFVITKEQYEDLLKEVNT
jgi:hypothetical protein